MGSKYQGTNEEQHALDAFIALMRSAASVGNTLSRQRAFGELSPSQFSVLEALLHLGPLSQKELARKLLRSSGNLVMVIDNLTAKDLVTRNRSEKDRRMVQVSLTKKGRELIGRLFPRHVAIIKDSMSALSYEKMKQLKTLCRQLGTGQKEDE